MWPKYDLVDEKRDALVVAAATIFFLVVSSQDGERVHDRHDEEGHAWE